ncbi:hypothetical protein [Amycolatopsis pithecellobii]|uniref:Uncharacterized protein n=1 Tax=Amycolatopsis pithecellobii TaxID=664692 RepID=A0A6N7ZAL7_9PSEU|nr:hypothetical protein [Amycolatopsis pithecellobii]MTD58777.1 hypothetical protein [Amycolatopsis pithecellobii]
MMLYSHGSPGSGKTTLSRAVIDLGDLSNVHPSPDRSFARKNLKAIWPNYAAIPQLTPEAV